MCGDCDGPESACIIRGPTLRRVEDQHSHNAFAAGNVLRLDGQRVTVPGRPTRNPASEKQQPRRASQAEFGRIDSFGAGQRLLPSPRHNVKFYRNCILDLHCSSRNAFGLEAVVGLLDVEFAVKRGLLSL